MYWIFYVLLFGAMYLAWCDCAMDPKVSGHQILWKSRKSVTETLAMFRRAFTKDSVRLRWVLEWNVLAQLGPESWDRWRAMSRVHSSFSLTSRGLFTKNLSWQDKQSIPHTAVTFFSDCMKMCKEFAPNFGNKRIGRCITTITQWIFKQKQHENHTPLTHPAYNFSLFLQLKTKLKDMIKVIEA
jgi:hypothetical protein